MCVRMYGERSALLVPCVLVVARGGGSNKGGSTNRAGPPDLEQSTRCFATSRNRQMTCTSTPGAATTCCGRRPSSRSTTCPRMPPDMLFLCIDRVSTEHESRWDFKKIFGHRPIPSRQKLKFLFLFTKSVLHALHLVHCLL